MTRAGHALAPLEIDACYRLAGAARDVRNGFRLLAWGLAPAALGGGRGDELASAIQSAGMPES